MGEYTLKDVEIEDVTIAEVPGWLKLFDSGVNPSVLITEINSHQPVKTIIGDAIVLQYSITVNDTNLRMVENIKKWLDVLVEMDDSTDLLEEAEFEIERAKKLLKVELCDPDIFYGDVNIDGEDTKCLFRYLGHIRTEMIGEKGALAIMFGLGLDTADGIDFDLTQVKMGRNIH